MTPAVLQLHDVTFRRNGTQILHGIDLTVQAGEHWALLGPNGAGKSTILSFCGARVHPTSGAVEVLGQRLGRVELQLLHREIGHVNPRHPLGSALSVTDVVLTGITGTIERPLRWAATPDQVRRAHELIEEVGLTARRDAAWPVLSQGERGRSLIARALISDPRLVLLDEPATGLDLAAREQLLETIDRLAHTAPEVASVLVTHHLEELPESTTHAVVIREGRVLAAGPIDQAVTTESISAAFGLRVAVAREHGRWSARAGRSVRAVA